MGKRTAGVRAVERATRRLGVDLAPLVAEVAVWASANAHRALQSPENPHGARYPNVRRARMGSGEKPGTFIEDIRLDRNNYAGNAIRTAIPNGGSLTGYHACHVWPDTCYDERYHTVLANLVLVPAPLAGLTDFQPGVIRALQFRSYDLFGWHPDEVETPARPANYPTNWQEPEEGAVKRRSSPAPRRSSGTARGPRKGRSQRDIIRDAWAKQPGNDQAAIDAWVEAIATGEVERRSNDRGQTDVEYAKRLIYDGLKKGWLS